MSFNEEEIRKVQELHATQQDQYITVGVLAYWLVYGTVPDTTTTGLNHFTTALLTSGAVSIKLVRLLMNVPLIGLLMIAKHLIQETAREEGLSKDMLTTLDKLAVLASDAHAKKVIQEERESFAANQAADDSLN